MIAADARTRPHAASSETPFGHQEPFAPPAPTPTLTAEIAVAAAAGSIWPLLAMPPVDVGGAG
eukprot:174206-Karenia_brevis.AAC.1